MLFKEVKRTIDRNHLLKKGDRVIVGVSGGVDSMVLLHLLDACRQEFGLSLIVAHVNHGLRPDESKKEADLVRSESERLVLPFEYRKVDVEEFRKRKGLSVQDAARRLRFDFFNSLLLKYDAQKIALGHNADDQVETVLMRMIRGSGLRGLKGMLPIREGKVIRPLLEVWRTEIDSFAEKNRIPFLLDLTNLQGDYFRNRLRLALIPLIEKEYQPGFKAVVLRASRILRDEDDCLDGMAEKAYQKVVQEEKGSFSFRFSDYRSLHKAIQWRLIQKVLGRILGEEKDAEKEKWRNVGLISRQLERVSSSIRLEFSCGVWFEKRYDLITLRRCGGPGVPPFEVELVSPGRTFISEIEREVAIEECDWNDGGELSGVPDTAILDYQSLTFPLKMRNFRAGDRFQPLGTRGTQKVKDFFIDHKIPKFERAKIPLLISGKMIAWVGGYRIDERVKVTEKTQTILRIQLSQSTMIQK